MASLARLPALGRKAVSFTLIPQIADATTGALSDATISGITSFSFFGVMKTCKRRQHNTTEDISPSSVRSENNVITGSGAVYDITGFCLANDSVSSPTNVIDAVVQAADYVKLVTNYKGNTETFTAVVVDFETGVESKGSVPFSLSISNADIGTANPSFA